MTAMTLKIIGQKTAIAKLGKNEVVLLPLSKYQAFMQRLEELEDILDTQRAMEEYHAGKGKLFTDYVNERRAKSF